MGGKIYKTRRGYVRKIFDFSKGDLRKIICQLAVNDYCVYKKFCIILGGGGFYENFALIDTMSLFLFSALTAYAYLTIFDLFR